MSPILPLLFAAGLASASAGGDKDYPGCYREIDANDIAGMKRIIAQATAADLNRACKNGWTPLSSAVASDRAEIAEALVEGGASFAVDSVQKAIHYRDYDLAYWLLARGTLGQSDLDGLLQDLADGGGLYQDSPDPAVIDRLIKAGADPNHRDKTFNATPLWLAVDGPGGRPMPEIAKALIAAKADLNLHSWNNGDTALTAAVDRKEDDVIDALVAAGADLNATDHKGRTALMHAADHEHARELRRLLKAGADVSIKDEDGQTVRDLAHDDEVREILDEFAQRAPAASAAPPSPKAPPAAKPQAKVSAADTPSYSRAEDERKFALVIGIGRYKSLPEAEFAEQDASAVRRHLLALGYPQRNIIYVAGQDASKSGLEKYLQSWLPKNIKEDSRLFVYFSGHGAPEPKTGQAYLVPWDGDPKFLENTGYPLERFYRELSALRARSVVVALDSCFSGAGGRSVLAKGTRPLVAKVSGLEAQGDRIAVLAAASGDEVTGTRDGEGHGLFTFHLLQGLNAKKGQAGVQALFDYLRPRVEDDARRDNRDQTPRLTLPKAAATDPQAFGL